MKHNLTTHPSLVVELYTGRAASAASRLGGESLCQRTNIPSSDLPQSSDFLKQFYIYTISVLGFLDLILNPKTAGQDLLACATAYWRWGGDHQTPIDVTAINMNLNETRNDLNNSSASKTLSIDTLNDNTNSNLVYIYKFTRYSS